MQSFRPSEPGPTTTDAYVARTGATSRSNNNCLWLWVPAFAGTTPVVRLRRHFFTSEHSGLGGPNASSPEIVARIL